MAGILNKALGQLDIAKLAGEKAGDFVENIINNVIGGDKKEDQGAGGAGGAGGADGEEKGGFSFLNFAKKDESDPGDAAGGAAGKQGGFGLEGALGAGEEDGKEEEADLPAGGKGGLDLGGLDLGGLDLGDATPGGHEEQKGGPNMSDFFNLPNDKKEGGNGGGPEEAQEEAQGGLFA